MFYTYSMYSYLFVMMTAGDDDDDQKRVDEHNMNDTVLFSPFSFFDPKRSFQTSDK